MGCEAAITSEHSLDITPWCGPGRGGGSEVGQFADPHVYLHHYSIVDLIEVQSNPLTERAASHQPGCQYGRTVVCWHSRHIDTMWAEGAEYVHEAPAEYL